MAAFSLTLTIEYDSLNTGLLSFTSSMTIMRVDSEARPSLSRATSFRYIIGVSSRSKLLFHAVAIVFAVEFTVNFSKPASKKAFKQLKCWHSRAELSQ